MNMSRRVRGFLIAAPVLVEAVLLALHGPIPQDPEYHRFADTRALGGIPNAGDVLSNLALVLAGVFGLVICAPSLAIWGTRFAGPEKVALPAVDVSGLADWACWQVSFVLHGGGGASGGTRHGEVGVQRRAS